LIESIVLNFSPSVSAATTNRYIIWNNNNISDAILNVGGSCHDTPIRTWFGGVLRNDSCIFIAGFSGFIRGSFDILLAEFYAIYHGLIMAKDLGYTKLV